MDEFIRELMGRMTLSERIGQLNLVNAGEQPLTGAVANTAVQEDLIAGRVGILFGTSSLATRERLQTMSLDRSRLGIPLLFASDVVHGYRTALPLPIALSCSWDLELIERAAHLAATEAKADGIQLTFAPMVDVTRDPRWGRVAEGSGESPYLVAQIAAAAVRGFQGGPDDEGRAGDADRMLACVKHFVGYGAADGGRDYAGANLGPIELHETHFPPFEAAVQAGVAAVMPGFHAIDRVPVTADKRLLRGILRDRWRFLGVVISDYTAINELQFHGLGELATVSAIAIEAGVDVDMVGQGFVSTLEASVNDGRVDASRIDEACRRVLRMKWLAGLFRSPTANLNSPVARDVIGCTAHREEARVMAARSCVLLKNDAELLPLRGVASVALIGPLVDDRRNLPGTWSVSARSDECVSLLEGVAAVEAVTAGEINVQTARGCDLVDDPELAARLNVFEPTVTLAAQSADELIAEATATAAECDVVVVAVGEAREHSGECSSRSELDLPGTQRRLIDAIRRTGKPIVLVVFAGRPLVLTDVVESVDAILYVWYGGTMSGPAIADLLFGRAAPSGRLTMSFPRRVGQIPVHHDALPTGRPLRPGAEFEKFRSCYLDVVNQPLHPFGFGLTFTSFEYGTLTVNQTELTGDDRLVVSVPIQNVGARDGIEVVQLYVGDVAAKVSRPMIELKAFQRVSLAAGESELVNFEVTPQDLSYCSGDSILSVRREWEPGRFRISVGPDAGNLQTIEASWQSS